MTKCSSIALPENILLNRCLTATQREFDWNTYASFNIRKKVLYIGCLNTLASGCFRGFSEKTLKRTWLCAGISPFLFGLRTWSKRQMTRQVF